MSRFARAYYGAAFGALVSLLIHPASRPYILGALTSWGPSQAKQSTPWIPDNLSTLPRPASTKDLDTMALWMQAGAEAILRRRLITPRDFDKLIQVATIASAEEKNNAFWPQMKAVLLEERGYIKEAREVWKQASLCSQWNDRQSSRLLEVRREVASEWGAEQAWQLQTVYGLRSPATAQAIVRYAKHLLQSAGLETKKDLESRYLTLVNALILRDGSRSLDAGIMGSNLMEAASYPKGMVVITSQKKLLLAREKFFHSLGSRGMAAEASFVYTAYGKNDAWVALTQYQNPTVANISLVAVGCLATAVFPGISLAVAAFGALLWLAGLALFRFKGLQRVFQPPLAPVIGVVVAIATYMATDMPLAAITAVLCFAFLVFSPSHERTKPPEDLGPMFGFTMFLLGFALFITLGAFIIGVSTPGNHVFAWLGVPRDYYNGSTLFLGLSGILLGLMLLAAPTWAMIEHVSTPTVVAMALRSLGSGMCAVCLGLAVCSAPLAVYADRKVGETLQQLVENEPNYYLIQ